MSAARRRRKKNERLHFAIRRIPAVAVNYPALAAALAAGDSRAAHR